MQPVLIRDISNSGKSDESPSKRSAAPAQMQGVRGGGEAEARTGDSFRLRWQQAIRSVGETHPGEGEKAKSIASGGACEADVSKEDPLHDSSPLILSDPPATDQTHIAKANVIPGKQVFVLQQGKSELAESAGGADDAKHRFPAATGSAWRLDAASPRPGHSAKDELSRVAGAAPDALTAQLHIALTAPVAPASELDSEEADEIGLKEDFEKHPVSFGQIGPGSSPTIGRPELKSQGFSHFELQPSMPADSVEGSAQSECFQDSGHGAAAGVVSEDFIERGSVFALAAGHVESHPDEAFSGSQRGNQAFQAATGPLDGVGKADAESVPLAASIPLSNSRGQQIPSGIERAHHIVQLPETTDTAAATGVATVGVPVQTNAAGSPHALNAQLFPGKVDQNPFAALDAGIGDRAANWNHAGPQHAEVGYMDPALGWVTVRADLHGGNVHAAVVGSSPDSATVLGAELAGLNAHLAEKRIPVESLTIGGALSHETASHNAMAQGNGEQDARGSRQGSARIFTTDHASLISAKSGAIGSEMPSVGSTGTGIHISVRV
jgi:hypothetical protein